MLLLWMIFYKTAVNTNSYYTIITELSIILPEYFPFSQVHVQWFHILSFSHKWYFHSHQHLSFFHFWFEYYLPWNLHLHDICFINVFYSFVLVIMLSYYKYLDLYILFCLCFIGWIIKSISTSITSI